MQPTPSNHKTHSHFIYNRRKRKFAGRVLTLLVVLKVLYCDIDSALAIAPDQQQGKFAG